jgi:hypothetical protein
LIREIETEKDDAVGKFGFVNSTIKMIGKNSTKIISGFEHLFSFFLFFDFKLMYF